MEKSKIELLFEQRSNLLQALFEVANNSFYFDIENTKNYYGDNKSIIVYNGPIVQLNKNTESIVQLVIDKTKNMYFNDFIDYVYSTFPIKNNNRYAILDLPRLALEYRNL